MSGFRLLKDKILDKFDHLTEKWNDFTQKVAKINRNLSQRFAEFSEKFDEMVINLDAANPEVTEIMNGLKTKELIRGDITFQNIEDFSRTLWESHDMAQQAFEETRDSQYHEMAMEALLVIQEMELLKEYLGKHGKM